MTSIDINVHCLQLKSSLLPSVERYLLPRIISEKSPRLPYRRRQGEVKSTLHWGQRKLFLAEMEFLIKCYKLNDIPNHSSLDNENCNTNDLKSYPYDFYCIYAGAAPGTHLPFLSQLFPRVYFVLIDPSNFAIPSNNLIEIRQEFMKCELALQLIEEYKSNNDFKLSKLIFICDIRSVDYRVISSEETDDGIMKDMNMQMEWYKLMKPFGALLKFRLPYSHGQTTYLDGDLYFPIFGTQTTSECRLMIFKNSNSYDNITVPYRVYDHKIYNEQLFYFNTITRCRIYTHCCDIQLLDHCYDCTVEVNILESYYQLPFHSTTTTLIHVIESLSQCISFACSNGMNIRQVINGKDMIPLYHRYALKKYNSIDNTIEVLDNHLPISHKRKHMHDDEKVLRVLFDHIQMIDQAKVEITWIDIPEIVEDNKNCIIGNIGGSQIEPYSTLHLWILHVVYELMNPIKSHDYEILRLIKDSSINDLLNFKHMFTLEFPQLKMRQSEEKRISCLLLLTSSGCGYFIFSNELITKLTFPCLNNNEGAKNHHLTLFEVSIELLEDDLMKSKLLWLNDVIAINTNSTIHLSIETRIKLLHSILENELDMLMNQYEILLAIGFNDIKIR